MTVTSTTLELLLKAKDEASSVFKGLKGHVDSVASGITGLAGKAASLTPLAGAGIALAGAFSFEKALSSASELGSEIIKLKRETGLSAEEASKLHFQWQETGVSFETGEKGLKKFYSALGGISDLSDGVAIPTGKAMVQLLGEMGITAEDAAGKQRPLNDILGDTAERFKNMPDGVVKSDAAVKLFGKSGMDLLPFLNKGRDGLKELGNEAAKFGLVLDQKTLDSMKKQKIASREFHAALEGISVQIGIVMLPVMTRLAEAGTFLAIKFNQYVVPAIKKVGEVVSDFVQTIEGGLTGDVTQAAEAFSRLPGPLQAVALWLAKNKEAIIDFLENAKSVSIATITTAFDLLRTTLEKLQPIVAKVFDFISQHKEEVAAFAAGVILAVVVPAFIAWAFAAGTAAAATLLAAAPVIALALVIGLLGVAIYEVIKHHDAIKDKVVEVWGAISSFVNEKVPLLALVFTFVFELIKNQVTTAINVVRDVIHIVMSLIHGDWSEAWNGLKQLVVDVLDGFVNQVKLQLGFVIGIFALLGPAILEAISDLGKLLFDVGEQIIAGLLDGIKSKAADVRDWFKGFAGDVLSWAQDALEVNSPSRLMIPIGAGIVEGVAVGMENRKGVLQGQLDDMLNMVKNTAAAISSVPYYIARPNAPSAPPPSQSSGGDGIGPDPSQRVGGHTRDEWKFIFGASGVSESEYGQKLRDMFGYKMGTPYVPEDGWRYLHKGEGVTPASSNNGDAAQHTYYIERVELHGDPTAGLSALGASI